MALPADIPTTDVVCTFTSSDGSEVVGSVSLYYSGYFVSSAYDTIVVPETFSEKLVNGTATLTVPKDSVAITYKVEENFSNPLVRRVYYIDVNPTDTSIVLADRAPTAVVKTGTAYLTQAILDNPDSRLSDVALKEVFGSRHLNSVLLVGDSITAMAGVSVFEVYSSYSTNGFLTWAQMFLGQRLDATVDGVTGETAAQVVARLDNHLSLTPFAFVHLQAGTNDLIGGVPIATTKAAITAGLDKILASGALAIVGTLPPYTGATAAQAQFLTQLNRWIKELPTTRLGVIVADYNAALSRADGEWLGVGTTAYTADGTHPSTGGAARMGRILADLLSTRVPRWDRLPTSNLDSSGSGAVPEQLLTNPVSSGTAGLNLYGVTLTGTVADNWSTGQVDGWSPGTVVASKVVRTDQLPGEWQQYVCSGDPAPRIRHQQAVTGLSGGVTVQMFAEVETDNDLVIPDGGLLRVQLICYEAGTYAPLVVAMGPSLPTADSGAQFPLENRPASIVLGTPPVTLPAVFGGVTACVDFIGTGTVRIGRIAVLRS